MPTGQVKWYDPDKGFGFVAQDDGGADLFLHHSMIGQELLAEGDRISYVIGYGVKGPRAEDVQILERSGNQPRPRRPREFGENGYGYAPRNASGYGPGNGARYSGGSVSRAPVNTATLPRMEGVVRRFDYEKGFGFISSHDAENDVFFHGSVVVGDSVRQGDTVEFRLGQSQRGPRAEEVRLISNDR